MITVKFGGTAMAAQNFGCLRRLVTENYGCVVVSAVGKEFPSDVKTTDLLVAHFNGDNSAWDKIAAKYKRVVQINGVNIDVEKLLWHAKRVSLIHNLAYCMSLGEQLSAKIAAAYLDCAYVEAEKCVTFDCCGKLCWRETKKNIQSAFGGLPLGVIGGFYGGISNGGRAVFSRGGSDVTGAICAAALGSTLYENRTDVNGVYSANPKRIFGAKTICSLSYGEMYRLAKNGAEVLHPDAVRYCARCGIPICVCGFLSKCGPSTLVSNCPSRSKVLAVTEKQLKTSRSYRVLTTVLHSIPFDEVSVGLENFFVAAKGCGFQIFFLQNFSRLCGNFK